MTIWEKALINMQKGTQKLSATAALFSERVRAEIDIARLRIRLREVESLINEQYRVVGMKIVDLQNDLSLSGTIEQLMNDETIKAACAEIAAFRKEKTDILLEIKNLQTMFDPAPGKEETKI